MSWSLGAPPLLVVPQAQVSVTGDSEGPETMLDPSTPSVTADFLWDSQMLESLGIARIHTEAPDTGSGFPESHPELLVSGLSECNTLGSPGRASGATFPSTQLTRYPTTSPKSLFVLPRMDDKASWVLGQMLLQMEGSPPKN